MFELATAQPFTTKADLYDALYGQLAGLLAGERDAIANLANAASLIFHTLPDLNWAGFYLMRGDELVLGPFHGKPACIRIPVSRGVCGTAVAKNRTMVVEDVQAFPGHIACDAASRSELVVPLRRDGRIVGVLDLDSPSPGRFDGEDAAGCERVAQMLMAGSDPH